MYLPDIPATPIEPSSWESPSDAIPSLTGLARETARWAWYFANRLFPDDGLALEEALHWACFSRLSRGLARLARDLDLGDSEGVVIGCRLIWEAANNSLRMGLKEEGRSGFLFEGYKLEGRLRDRLRVKSKHATLDALEAATLDELNGLWRERGLPEKLPRPLGEETLLQQVEQGWSEGSLPLIHFNQAVHGTSRWLEAFDLVPLPKSIPSEVQRFSLRQEDPPSDPAKVLFTINRGFHAIEVLVCSIENLPPEIRAGIQDLEVRLGAVSSWFNGHGGIV